ncbi:MAG: hypothetical protein KJP21_05920, partial [Bacteroidia bacterium]|nr:hypothetical protein [Bacteroidia bacterium]
LALFFTLGFASFANAQTCPAKYAETAVDSIGLVNNVDYGLDSADNLGVTFSRGNSGTNSFVTYDLGEEALSGTEICLSVRMVNCNNSSKSYGEFYLYSADSNTNPQTGSFYAQGSLKTFTNSTWSEICVTLNRDSRYIRIRDAGGCEFQLDYVKWEDCNTIYAPSTPNCSGGNTFTWTNSISVSGTTVTAGNPIFVSGATTQFKIPTTLPNALNSGVYIKVTEAISWDGYNNRLATSAQPNEQWKVVYFKGGTSVYETPYTEDLNDGSNSAEWKGPLGVTKYFPNGVDSIYLVHYNDATYGQSSSTANSVRPVSVCFSYTPVSNKISGKIWEDINYNQVKEGSENLLSNVQVYLNKDINQNGTYDESTDILLDSTQTNGVGYYEFDSLNFGCSIDSYTQRISSTADDCDERGGSGNVSANWIGLYNENNGFRFNNVNIPDSAIILNAYLTLTASHDYSGTGTVVIKGEDTSNSSAYTSITNAVGGRTTTTENVTWSLPSFTANNEYVSPDLTDILEEITARSDWSSGNSISLLLYGPAASTASDRHLAYMFDASSTQAPQLHIEYVTTCDENYVITTDPTTLGEGYIMSTDAVEDAVFISGGSHDENNDFGITPPNEISGTVFYDKGRNGIKAGNIGEPDVKLYLIQNVDSTTINSNVNDSVDVSFQANQELWNNWRFRVKNDGNTAVMWTVTIENADYDIDTSDFSNINTVNYLKTINADSLYDYTFEGINPLPAGASATEIWNNAFFGSAISSDGFELNATKVLDASLMAGVVGETITDSNGEYVFYAPYTGGTD